MCRLFPFIVSFVILVLKVLFHPLVIRLSLRSLWFEFDAVTIDFKTPNAVLLLSDRVKQGPMCSSMDRLLIVMRYILQKGNVLSLIGRKRIRSYCLIDCASRKWNLLDCGISCFTDGGRGLPLNTWYIPGTFHKCSALWYLITILKALEAQIPFFIIIFNVFPSLSRVGQEDN